MLLTLCSAAFAQIPTPAPTPFSLDIPREGCPSGYYGPDAKSAANCTRCPAGYISVSNGQTACKFCTAGRYSTVTDVYCKYCPVGYYSETSAAASCLLQKTSCPEGYTAVINSKRCQYCRAGFYGDTAGLLGPFQCKSCPTGYYSLLSSVQFESSTFPTSCRICGSTLSKASSSYPDVNNSCSSYFQSSCGGTYSHSNKCYACPYGKYGGYMTRYYSVVSSTGISSGNFLSASLSISCENCVAGQYQDTLGTMTCKRCPMGKFQPSVSQRSCLSCAFHKTSYPGSTSEDNCKYENTCERGDPDGVIPITTSTDSNSYQYSPITCGPGKYVVNLASTAGWPFTLSHTTPIINAARGCVSCPEGYFSVPEPFLPGQNPPFPSQGNSAWPDWETRQSYPWAYACEACPVGYTAPSCSSACQSTGSSSGSSSGGGDGGGGDGGGDGSSSGGGGGGGGGAVGGVLGALVILAIAAVVVFKRDTLKRMYNDRQALKKTSVVTKKMVDVLFADDIVSNPAYDAEEGATTVFYRSSSSSSTSTFATAGTVSSLFDGQTSKNTGSGRLKSEQPTEQWLIVSTPKKGADEEGKFEVEVMEELKQLQAQFDFITLGYDWEGSTNQYPEDAATWDLLTSKDSKGLIAQWESASDGAHTKQALEKIRESVRSTRWFATYKGQIKGAARTLCLQGIPVCMVCIDGGPISKIEALEMPSIIEEIKTDLKEIAVQLNPKLTMQTYNTYNAVKEAATALQSEFKVWWS